jgi:hypothetical protein
MFLFMCSVRVLTVAVMVTFLILQKNPLFSPKFVSMGTKNDFTKRLKVLISGSKYTLALISLTHISISTSRDFVSLGTHEGVSKSFRTGRLERELQMVQLSATRCSCIAIL